MNGWVLGKQIRNPLQSSEWERVVTWMEMRREKSGWFRELFWAVVCRPCSRTETRNFLGVYFTWNTSCQICTHQRVRNEAILAVCVVVLVFSVNRCARNSLRGVSLYEILRWVSDRMWRLQIAASMESMTSSPLSASFRKNKPFFLLGEQEGQPWAERDRSSPQLLQPAATLDLHLSWNYIGHVNKCDFQQKESSDVFLRWACGFWTPVVRHLRNLFQRAGVARLLCLNLTPSALFPLSQWPPHSLPRR